MRLVLTSDGLVTATVDRHPQLTAELEAALVRELRATFWQLNDAFFKGGLRAPTIELVPTRHTLGRWVPATRTIEISRPLVLERPWGAVVEVLKHEMAHQYVHETLGERSQTPHGQAFRDACARLGVDARASGVPDAAGPDAGEEKIVERIARLLALAESPNRHEAEAAMAAAQRLMLKHNLDAARSAAARDFGHLHLGKPTGRVAEHERVVAMILGKHFFVEAIWIPVYRPLEGKRGSVLEICGTRANLAIAEYVHGFLHQTAERLWRDHRAARGIRTNRDRRTYLAGVMVGLRGQARETGDTQPQRGPRLGEGRRPGALLPEAPPVRASRAPRGAAAHRRLGRRARGRTEDRASQAGHLVAHIARAAASCQDLTGASCGG